MNRSMASSGIPPLFEDFEDYRYNLDALECAQATFNEEGLYLACESFAMDWWKRSGTPARILDLCCATGLFASRIAQQIPAASITLVDTDEDALSRAVKRLSGIAPEMVVEAADGADFVRQNSFDLILMNSAYHHISDERKPVFLRNARASLAPHGRILLGDHFLPPYEGAESFRNSVIEFYTALVEALQARGESAAGVNTIRCSAVYTLKRDYEFKVSWEKFQKDLDLAGLTCERFVPVWRPDPESRRFIGSAALVLC